LIEYGNEYTCNICRTGPIWNFKELRLQVDHINRNWLDDRPDNLRFLCPNCHSQTDGYNGSRGLTDLTNDNRRQRLRRKNSRVDENEIAEVCRLERQVLGGASPFTATNL
jgi:5-methylcytosine-specific restriction endonuclease McrA